MHLPSGVKHSALVFPACMSSAVLDARPTDTRVSRTTVNEDRRKVVDIRAAFTVSSCTVECLRHARARPRVLVISGRARRATCANAWKHNDFASARHARTLQRGEGREFARRTVSQCAHAPKKPRRRLDERAARPCKPTRRAHGDTHRCPARTYRDVRRGKRAQTHARGGANEVSGARPGSERPRARERTAAVRVSRTAESEPWRSIPARSERPREGDAAPSRFELPFPP